MRRGLPPFRWHGHLWPVNPPSPTHHPELQTAVHSIYNFVRRTEERERVGSSWETIDYENKPHRDIGMFNGVGGIPFFLTDYSRCYGVDEAIQMAGRAIDWCAAFPGECYERGLQFGRTGAAWAALYRSAYVEGAGVPEFSLANARIILSEPSGPVTDLIGGEASNGVYLLKLWARTSDPAHLAGACRCAAWIDSHIIRDARGTWCLINPDGKMGFRPELFLGAAHGISGIAHFLACLAEATREERWARLAVELFDTVERYAQPSRGGLNWPGRAGGPELSRCQYSHGAPGIGMTFLTAHRVLGDNRYRELALQAGEATYHYGDFRNNYTQCTGLAGGGELLLALHRLTGEAIWETRALEFARACIAYKETTPAGDAWPTDAKGLFSPDYMYGAAGVGHFLLRLVSQMPLPIPYW